MAETTADRFLGFPQLQDRIPLSRTTIWRREREGTFPRSVRISPGRRAWREREINEWCEQRTEDGR